MALRLDSHQHFWLYNETDYSWIDNYILRQDYLPSHFEPLLRDNGLQGCIAVQAREIESETDYLITLQEKNSFIKGVVGWVDLKDSNLPKNLAKFTQKVSGFRLSLESKFNEKEIVDSSVLKGIQMLKEFDFTLDLIVPSARLSLCAQLADQFPNQLFVINHLAKPDYSKNGFKAWAQSIQTLSKRENVFCKISGMVTDGLREQDIAEELAIDEYIPYLDLALETFTPSRLMFGSDWPLCTMAATFNEVYDVTSLYIEKLSKSEQEQVMGGSAALFYNIQPY